MFTRPVRLSAFPAICIVAIAAGLFWSGPSAATVQVADPRIEPIRPPTESADEQPSAQSDGRLAFNDLVYQGAFRVPADQHNGESFSYGGQSLSYNPVSNTLFVGSLHNQIAEISIPGPVKTTVNEELPVASFVQPFRDPADGRLRDIAESGVVLSGLHVQDGRLYGTGVIYYDATNAQRVSHFARSLDLTRPEVSRIYQVGDTGKSGFVAGYMATVPSEHRAALGGPAVTGQCCLAIISRTSFGPALFAWNPADLGRSDAVSATPLLFYPQQHPTLGPWEGTNEVYGANTEVAGVAIIGSTVLFAGRNGMGSYCYGEGTGDAAKAKERGPGGETFCYDPANSTKGQHSFPYRLQFWAYEVKDLAAVRARKRDPWEIKPYAVWPFELPALGDPYPRLGAVSYDLSGRRLFLTQLAGEKDGYSRRPIIHIFTVRG